MSVGVLTDSRGLFADGLHSFSDVIATGGVILSLRIADKGADPRYPYGRGKIEFVSCIFVYSVLFIIGTLIFSESVWSIYKGDVKAPGMVSLFPALFSVIANAFLCRLGKCAGKAVNSPAIIANANENKADSLSSVAVIAGIIAANLGYTYCDPLAAAGVGLVIMRMASKLEWRAIENLMDKSLPVDKLRAINERILEVEEVKKVNYIKTRQIGKQYWLDVEIQVAPSMTMRVGDVISKVVKKTIMNISEKIKDVTVVLACSKPEEKIKKEKVKLGVLGKLKTILLPAKAA